MYCGWKNHTYFIMLARGKHSAKVTGYGRSEFSGNRPLDVYAPAQKQEGRSILSL